MTNWQNFPDSFSVIVRLVGIVVCVLMIAGSRLNSMIRGPLIPRPVKVLHLSMETLIAAVGAALLVNLFSDYPVTPGTVVFAFIGVFASIAAVVAVFLLVTGDPDQP